MGRRRGREPGRARGGSGRAADTFQPAFPRVSPGTEARRRPIKRAHSCFGPGVITSEAQGGQVGACQHAFKATAVILLNVGI